MLNTPLRKIPGIRGRYLPHIECHESKRECHYWYSTLKSTYQRIWTNSSEYLIFATHCKYSAKCIYLSSNCHHIRFPSNVLERVEIPNKTTQLLNLNKRGKIWPHRDAASCKHSRIRGRQLSKTIHSYQPHVDRQHMDIYYPKPMDV